MKWGTVVALFGLAAGIIYLFFCFFVLGAGLVLGRPSHPPSSYHPKSVLIGICIYIIGRP